MPLLLLLRTFFTEDSVHLSSPYPMKETLYYLTYLVSRDKTPSVDIAPESAVNPYCGHSFSLIMNIYHSIFIVDGNQKIELNTIPRHTTDLEE